MGLNVLLEKKQKQCSTGHSPEKFHIWIGAIGLYSGLAIWTRNMKANMKADEHGLEKERIRVSQTISIDNREFWCWAPARSQTDPAGYKPDCRIWKSRKVTLSEATLHLRSVCLERLNLSYIMTIQKLIHWCSALQRLPRIQSREQWLFRGG